MTRVIGKRTQSLICGSKYNETLHERPSASLETQKESRTHAEVDIIVVVVKQSSSGLLYLHGPSSVKQSGKPRSWVTTSLLPDHQHLYYTAFIMDNSPTALFDSYEQDFQQVIESIKQKLDGNVTDERAGEFPLGAIHAEPANSTMDQIHGRRTLDESRWSWTRRTRWYVQSPNDWPVDHKLNGAL